MIYLIGYAVVSLCIFFGSALFYRYTRRNISDLDFGMALLLSILWPASIIGAVLYITVVGVLWATKNMFQFVAGKNIEYDLIDE